MAFNLFPYSNFHKLNLDWVIKEIKEAKAALDEAAHTVTTYEDRLASLESSVSNLSASVGLLRGTVSGHTMRLDQAQQDIQNHTQQINSLDSRLGLQSTTIQAQGLRIDQAQSDISNHTQQITQLGEDVAGKVDVDTGHAYDLRVIYNAEDPDNGVALEGMGGPFNGIAFRPVQDGQKNPLTFSPITVGAPTSANHAATKNYVDSANTQTLAALANKVDNLNGKAARLTLAAYQESGPSDQYGVRIDANPGTRTGLEFHPINNGTVDTNVFAELSIGDPTAPTSAATKRYVDQLINDRFRKLIINVFPYSNATNQNKVHYAGAYDITPTSQAEGFNSMREQLAALVGVGPAGAPNVRPRTVNIEIHAYNGEPLKTPAFSNLLYVMPAIYDLSGFPNSQSGSESGLMISVRGGAALPGSSRSVQIPNFTGDMYPTVCFTITSENTIEFFNWMEI